MLSLHFAVKSLYSSLSNEKIEVFASSCMWNPWVSSIAALLTCEAMWAGCWCWINSKGVGVYQTYAIFAKEKKLLIKSSFIVWKLSCCGGWLLNLIYLLFTYQKKKKKKIVYARFGIEWVMHSLVRDILLGWHGSFIRKKRNKAWRVASFSRFVLYGERNRRQFDNTDRADQGIKQSFMYDFLYWIRVYVGDCSLFLMDFVKWLSSM